MHVSAVITSQGSIYINKFQVDNFVLLFNSCTQNSFAVNFAYYPSSETKGQSVGSGEKARRKFSSTDERAPGYRLSPSYFQKFKRMPAPDWAQKMLCIIAPNRRTVSLEFFS